MLERLGVCTLHRKVFKIWTFLILEFLNLKQQTLCKDRVTDRAARLTENAKNESPHESVCVCV